MIKNYIKTALRSFKSNKVYSLINLIGLIIGLSVSIIIIVFVKHELSYDKFHENSGEIYRLGLKEDRGGKTIRSAITSPAMGPDLVEEIPEIKDQVILRPYGGATLQWETRNYQNNEVVLAGSSFFEMFSFNLISGTKEEVLKQPNSIVLTEKLSSKIFGDKEPVGKTLLLHNKFRVTVTGIAENVTQNSHIQFDAVASFSTLRQIPDFCSNWNCNYSYYTYLLFDKGITPRNIESKTSNLFYKKVNKRMEEHSGWHYEPIFEPMEDIYLKSDLLYDFMQSGNMKKVYIFSGIAFFILLIATINFMNLTTALSLRRIKEVGIRKVAGASKKKIVKQFLGESVLLSLVALIGALIVIELTLPYFNQLFHKDMVIYAPVNWPLLFGLPLFILLIGILAGSYPAFYIARFKPVAIMQKNAVNKKGNLKIQNLLVLVQFIISIGLIITSLVIYSQLNYMAEKEVGYNKKNLIAIRLDNERCVKKSEMFRDKLVNHTGVEHATVASDFPVRGLTQNGYSPEGTDQFIMIHALYVDPYYIETLELELKEGRNFRKGHTSDEENILINETLAKNLNWQNPVGKTIERNSVSYKVIGVVKDFHFESFRKPIGPVIFTLKPRKDYILARIKEENYNETVQYIEKEWTSVTGNQVMNYFSINQMFKNMYQSESQFGETVLFFTFLAIFLACLGLFGLTAISTTLRTKEIGIRKTLGARFISLNLMLLRQYTKWVMIANVVAWPVAYYLMREWLRNFAYKIQLDISYFILAGLFTLLISIITISYLAVKASRANPVDSLRYE